MTQHGGATLHQLGHTSDFPELLAASDLVVGKAGGLTVAEATTLGVPQVIHQPIPGQEEHNADYWSATARRCGRGNCISSGPPFCGRWTGMSMPA